jgi:hypothetical protein
MDRRNAIALVLVVSVIARAQTPTEEPPPPPPPPTTQAQPYYAPQPQPQAYKPVRIDDWHEGEPMPEGYHQVKRIRTGLVTGGAITFGVTYFISVLIAAIGQDVSAGNNPFWPQFIPVVGPFIQIGVTPLATVAVYCTFLGLAQAGGLAMFIAGFAAPHSYLVRDSVAKNNLQFTPFITPTTSGFALSGRF